MVRQIWWSVLVILASVSGLFVAGCDSGVRGSRAGTGQSVGQSAEHSDPGDPPGPQTEPPLVDDADSVALEVTVSVVDRAGFEEILAKHKGKVVLVDYWATWCPPCRKMFPHTVALFKQHQAEGLSVISVAMDDDDAHGDVVEFLTKQQARFDNLRSKLGSSDEAFESFEIPAMALPCLRLFGRDGEVLKTFAIDETVDKQFTHEDVAEAVRAALAAK